MKLGWKIAIGGIVLLFIIGIGFIVYSLWFEFKNSDVEAYINQEAQKYPNPQAAKQIISEGVQDILLDYNLTRQVKTYARMKNLSNEQAIVVSAVAEAKAHDYLAAA